MADKKKTVINSSSLGTSPPSFFLSRVRSHEHLAHHHDQEKTPQSPLIRGNDQSHVNLMRTKVDTLRALLSEKDAEYAEMCQQFEVNLRSKNQQIKSLESHINKMSSQLNLMQTEITTKTDQINALQLTVSKLQEALQHKDVSLLQLAQQEQTLQGNCHTLTGKLQRTETKLAEREQKLEKVTRECELVRQVQSNEITRLADYNAVLKEGLESSSKKLEEKEELLYNLRKEIASLVTVTSDKNSRITDLEQMFKQKMAQVSTIQDHLAEEHKKCTNLQKSMDEANKELHQLKQSQSSYDRVDQYTQTNQSNGCNCNCTTSSKSSNQEPNDLEALKKYHEDLEGTVSQLENILHVREKKIAELETKLTEIMLSQKQQFKELRLAILQSEMEEKDTAIALLEISDGCHGHREKIVELQEQKNILMKMIKQHVGGDGDTQLVIDKTATQLKCLLEQLVNLVQQDDHVIQIDNDTVKDGSRDHNGSCDHNGLLTHANIIINDTLQHFKSHPLQLSS